MRSRTKLCYSFAFKQAKYQKSRVFIDALGTQTGIRKLINDKQGFYLLAVKDNQKSLNDEVERVMLQLSANRCCHNEIDSYSGKVIQRKCEVFKANPKVITTSDIGWT